MTALSASMAGLLQAHPLRCLDPALLALPFFEDRHRTLAKKLERWLLLSDAAIEGAVQKPPAEAGRRLVHLLGQEGWLELPCEDEPDFRALCLVREAFAYRHDLLDFAFSIQALAAAPLVFWGTPEQKERHLPRLRSGAAIGCLAISEAGAGSDLGAVSLRAQRLGDGYKLTGEKCWIGHAGITDLHCVLARTHNTSGPLGLSVLVVDQAEGGVTATPVEMLSPRAFGTVHFKDCRVPAREVVGGEGAGFAVVADVLERYRLTVGAAANGMARRALHAARSHVCTRVSGPGVLADLPTVRERLADMSVQAEVAGLAVAHAAWEMDTSAPHRATRSSIAKLVATEAAQDVVDGCVQLHGAAGLVHGSVPEQLYRSIRSLRIYEGTSEIQKAIIGAAVVAGKLS